MHYEVAVRFVRSVAVRDGPPVRIDVKLVDGRSGRSLPKAGSSRPNNVVFPAPFGPTTP
jgi:hypothetical protein